MKPLSISFIFLLWAEKALARCYYSEITTVPRHVSYGPVLIEDQLSCALTCNCAGYGHNCSSLSVKPPNVACHAYSYQENPSNCVLLADVITGMCAQKTRVFIGRECPEGIQSGSPEAADMNAQGKSTPKDGAGGGQTTPASRQSTPGGSGGGGEPSVGSSKAAATTAETSTLSTKAAETQAVGYVAPKTGAAGMAPVFTNATFSINSPKDMAAWASVTQFRIRVMKESCFIVISFPNGTERRVGTNAQEEIIDCPQFVKDFWGVC